LLLLLRSKLYIMIAKSTLPYAAALAWMLNACGNPVQPGTNNPQDEIRVPPSRMNTPARILLPMVIAGTTELVKELIDNRKDQIAIEEIDSVELMTPIQLVQEKLAPPVQPFTVDNSRDTIITCDHGTLVYLPANTFATEGEQVQVNVQEFYETTEFISRDLSTTSDGQLLESAGTVKVTAIGEEGWLEVKEGESYTVLFPKTPAADMELFYGERGEDGIMDWTPAAEEQEPAEVITAEAAPENEELLNLIEYRVWMDDFYRPSVGFKNKWRFKEGEDRNLTQYFNEEFNGYERQPADYENYNPGANLSWGEDHEDLWYNVYFDENGKVISIRHEDWIWNIETDRVMLTYRLPGSTASDFDSSVMAFLYNMPAVDLKTMNRSINGKQKLCFTVKRHVNREDYKEKFLAKHEKYRENVIEKMPQAELDYFVLSSTEVGWLNCDRFFPDNGKRTDLTVQAPRMGETKYYMVYENFNAVVCGSPLSKNIADFKGAPLGNPVKIVAISSIGDQPVMAVKRVVLSEPHVMLHNFVPFSISELEAELR
jgi:hypothetical protein